MQIKAHNINKRVTPNVGISVFHAGKMDYRVVLDGIGQDSRYTSMGESASRMNWIAKQDQESINWVCANIQNRNA